jgi:hypothetical protein
MDQRGVSRAPSPTIVSKAICYIAATLLVFLGLLSGLLMLAANMNIRFNSTPQLGMFVAGWSLVVTSAFAAFRLFRAPGYRRLWLLVPPMVCLMLVCWLHGFPENQHLMH